MLSRFARSLRDRPNYTADTRNDLYALMPQSTEGLRDRRRKMAAVIQDKVNNPMPQLLATFANPSPTSITGGAD